MYARALIVLAILVALAACVETVTTWTDPPPPPETYLDAQNVYSDLYCVAYLERCAGPGFYGTNEECRVRISTEGCQRRDCSMPYPEDHVEDLHQCIVDMHQVACNAQAGPASCTRALAQ